MSMQTSVVSGYGIDSAVLEQVTTENVIGFVKKHCSLLYEMMMEEVGSEDGGCLEDDCKDWLCENGEFGDRFSDSDEWDERKYHLIATVMKRETGVAFEYVKGNDPDLDGNKAILLAPCMPWNYSATERGLTEQELSDLFKGYFTDLKLDVAPEYVEVFYYG